MEYQHLLIREEGNIRTITINRESKLNALNGETIRELGAIIDDTEKNEGIRVAIITGAGDKAFVAGADISEFSNYNASQGEELARIGQQLVFDRIHHSAKPFIAAINGFALGGGLELAMACHIRVASEQAKMGLPEVSLGLIPGYGGTQRLTQLVGRGKALELIMTADMLTATEALSWGLVNHVVEGPGLMDKVGEIAARIAQRSGTAVAAAIRAVNAGLDPTLDPTRNGYETEIKAFGTCFGTRDFTEGVSAFLEKRKPNF